MSEWWCNALLSGWSRLDPVCSFPSINVSLCWHHPSCRQAPSSGAAGVLAPRLQESPRHPPGFALHWLSSGKGWRGWGSGTAEIFRDGTVGRSHRFPGFLEVASRSVINKVKQRLQLNELQKSLGGGGSGAGRGRSPGQIYCFWSEYTFAETCVSCLPGLDSQTCGQPGLRTGHRQVFCLLSTSGCPAQVKLLFITKPFSVGLITA